MKKEMIKMDKQAKSDLVVVGLFLVGVVVLLGFVFGAVLVTTVTGASNFTFNEDTYMLYNISFNASVPQDQNLSSITITLPASFTLNNTYTNASFINNYSVASNVITYINYTGGYFNATNITLWFNASASTPGNFNLTLAWTNGSLTNSTNINIFVNDTSYPTGITVADSTILTLGNYSGSSKLINISITEDLPSQVVFNITNSLGVQNQTLIASRQGSTSYYNASLDTTTLPEGNVTLIVQVNDTRMGTVGTDISLSNRSWNITFVIDNIVPGVAIAVSNVTRTSIVFTATVSGATSIPGTCTIDRAGASVISGTGTLSQVISEGGLSCYTTYSYIVTCTDAAGNSASSSSASFKTSVCGGSVGGSSGGSSTTWSMTYSPLESELVSTEGYTKEMKVKERIKVEVYSDGLSSGSKETHHVGVKEIKTDSVIVEVASVPVEVELNAGEDASVDVNEDGYYDVYVKLNAITNGKADLTIMKVYEEVSAESEGDVETSGEVVSDEVPEKEGKSAPWMIIIIVLVILAVAIGGGIAWKNR